jgi:hypothetical protein
MPNRFSALRMRNRAEQMIAEKRRRLAPARPEMIERELRRTKTKQQNLLALAEKAKAPTSILKRIAELDAQARALSEQLATMNKPARPVAELDGARLRKALCARLNEFDGMITADVPLARQALRKLLDGPISFEATPEGYVLRGSTKIGALFPPGYIAVVPRKGLEPPQCCHR